MGHLTMNNKEWEQTRVFEDVKEGKLSKTEAAMKLGITPRWVRKKIKRFLIDGKQGLAHKSRGKKSSLTWDSKYGDLLSELYLHGNWHGFGPTYAAEKLKEMHNIVTSKETVRMSLTSRGLWAPKQQKIRHRTQRERKKMIGLMIQLDGSPHDWFEGRGGPCTLLVFIDDATSKIMWLGFVKSESVDALMQATLNYVKKHGIPCSFYVDHGAAFSVNLNNAEREKITQWERALKDLGVTVIHANSPQAKGCVERCNKTMQDRLVKELRLAGICSIVEANRFLLAGDFIQKHNDKFAVPPAQNGDAHKPAQNYDLESIFTIRATRVLANDYTITFNKRVFQLHSKQRTIIRPKNEITVCVRLDGSIFLQIRKTELFYSEITERPKQEKLEVGQVMYLPKKPSENSRRWVSGLPSIQSRMKPALPAVEAIR